MSTGPAPGTDEGEKLGKYRLLKRLGIGGMAEVYLAETLGTAGFQKRLVVKRVLPELQTNPSFIEMFLDEARLAARLSHPNIAQTFDLGKADGSYYIAMEHVPGITLRALFGKCQEEGREFPVDAAIRVMTQLLEALEYAHALADDGGRPLKIVHRDVTPANVMVTPQGGVKLLDFGIARAVTRQHRTQVGFTKGKFGFMAPEQVKGEELDGRTDIFAAGTVFYILLTGYAPFALKAESREDLRDMVEGRFVPPRIRRPSLAPRLEEIILKAMAKRREDRYPTAGAMLQDLEDFAADARLSIGGRPLQELVKSAFAEFRPAAPDQTISEPGLVEPPPPPEETSNLRATMDLPPHSPEARLTISTKETILDDEGARTEDPADDSPLPAKRKSEAPESSLTSDPRKLGVAAFVAVVAIALVVLVAVKVVGRAEPPLADEVAVRPSVPKPVVKAPLAASPSTGTPAPAGGAGGSGAAAAVPPLAAGSAAATGPALDPMARPLDPMLTPAGPEAERPVDPMLAPGPSPEAPEPEVGASDDTRPVASVSPRPAARAKKAPAVAAAPATPPPPAEPVDPSLLGSVRVTSVPEAVVRVKGRVLGKTPLRFDLPAGMHRLELDYTGAGAKRTLLVNVVAGQETPISEKLSR